MSLYVIHYPHHNKKLGFVYPNANMTYILPHFCANSKPGFEFPDVFFFLLNDLRWEVLGLVLSSIYSNSWLVSQCIGHTFDNRHPNDSDQFWLKLVLCRGFRWEDFWKGLPQSYILLSRYLGI